MDTYKSLSPKVVEGEHVIGQFVGCANGPTLVVIGSLHGNEQAGAVALFNIEPALSALESKLKGRVYFLAGNTRAFLAGKRFIDADLNRHWTPENLTRTGRGHLPETSEGVELRELENIIDHILVTAEDEVYVLDLHSTSADGRPFGTVGDTLRNRSFAQKFPITILLGIEEQLSGTMLEYLNTAGTVTLGFEGGQHTSMETVANHEALVWMAMANAGILNKRDRPVRRYHKHLAAGRTGNEIFEVRYRHAIKPEMGFKMNPGFNNFDPIRKGDPLAKDKNGVISASESGVLLMPLYQALGEDGFFIGRNIAPFWLFLSKVLRNLHVQNLIRYLPGVRPDPNDPETLIVNTGVARLFPLQIFHLLGFRRRRWSNKKLVVSRRKHDVRSPFKKRW